MSDPRKEIIIDYTNWRGERSLRRILPMGIEFQNNEWHPEMQWMIEAIDLDKNEFRCFALVGIHCWYKPDPLEPKA